MERLCKTCGKVLQRKATHVRYCGYACYPNVVKSRNPVYGACDICLNPCKLFQDHCHKTGRLRGRLCVRCNSMLGSLDDTEYMTKALAYLRQWKL